MILEIEQLNFSYDSTRTDNMPTLQNISLRAKKGENIGIIGANGSGKSTLLKVLAGLHLNYSGKICIQEIILQKKTVQEIQGKLGYIFQDADSQLFLSTVEEELRFGPMNQKLNSQDMDRRVREVADYLKITDIMKRQISKLSGGEKRLVSIGSVLTMKPEILLMDEPTTALDSKNRRRFIGLFQELQQTKIMVSHDLDLILETCERTILLDHGKIIFDGDTKDILQNQSLLSSYDLELPLLLQKNPILHCKNPDS